MGGVVDGGIRSCRLRNKMNEDDDEEVVEDD